MHPQDTGRKTGSGLEPLFVSIKQAAEITSDSEWRVKQLLAEGVYRAVKSGRRTLVEYTSIKARCAALPIARFAPPRRKRAAGESAQKMAGA